MIRSSEIVPLSESLSRQEAAARCIGPITTLATIKALDEYDPQVVAPPTEQESIFDMLQGPTAVFRSISGDGRTTFFYEKLGSYARATLTQAQKMQFSRYTHYGMQLGFSLSESFLSHSGIAAQVAIPAYLSAKDNIDANDAVSHANAYPISGLAKLLHADDFKKLLRQLSKAPNGTYPHMDNYHPDIASRDVLRQVLIMPPIAYDEICSLDKHGAVKLSPKMRGLLSALLHGDNAHGYINAKEGMLSGSRGCPMNIKAVSSRPDDFTEQQWAALLEGPNPPYEFDTDQNVLTARRNMIDEYTDFLAAHLDRATI